MVSPPAGQDPRGIRFNVRGFNDTTVLRDGFRLTDNNLFPQEIAGLEQIEVLKGPASIVFGAVEPGGVINLVSKQPLSEEFSELGLRVGNRGLVETSVDISGLLTDDGSWLYRLNLLYRTEDSLRDFDIDSERFYIAPVVTWDISDRTDLTFSFEYIDDQVPADFGLRPIGDEITGIPLDRNFGEPDDIVTTEYLRTGYQFEHRFSDTWKVRNGFSYTRRDNQLISATVQSFNEETGDLFRGFNRLDNEDGSFELQTNVVGEFATGAIAHTLLFGVDLSRRENAGVLKADFFTPAPLNIFNPVYGQTPRPNFDFLPTGFISDNRLDTLGLYVQDQIAIADNLKFLAGIRYDTFEQEQNSESFFFPEPVESTQSESAFSPRLSLVYQPIEEVSLFGSYSRSFVPNPGTSFNNEILEPEAGEQFEVGVKAELLDGRIAANLAYFDITLQNVATPDPINPNFSTVTGEERSRGVELDVVGEILPGWNIIANYAYIDAEITEDNSGLEGNRRFGVPKNNANLWTTYDIQDGALEGLGFGLGVSYVGERFGDNANTYTVDDYFLTNAAISYEKDNWKAGLNVQNLFDIDYIESSFNGRNGAIPGEDFTVVGSFFIEF
ncbi:MAG: TonB-dependent siderophore receptor [Cyanobacteria bacterium P01_B01_bin.77]